MGSFGGMSPFVILLGVLLIGLVFMMLRSSRKTLERIEAPRRQVAYECVATPLAKANAELRGKFPRLDSLDTSGDVHLLRFGLFNWGALPLEPDDILEPIVIRFAEGTQVLDAELAETIKTDADLPGPLQFRDAQVTLPPFAMAARGTVIFNLVVRGNGKPVGVDGRIAGAGPIRKLP